MCLNRLVPLYELIMSAKMKISLFSIFVVDFGVGVGVEVGVVGMEFRHGC